MFRIFSQIGLKNPSKSFSILKSVTYQISEIIFQVMHTIIVGDDDMKICRSKCFVFCTQLDAKPSLILSFRRPALSRIFLHLLGALPLNLEPSVLQLLFGGVYDGGATMVGGGDQWRRWCSSAGDGLHSYTWFVVYESSQTLQCSSSACLYL